MTGIPSRGALLLLSSALGILAGLGIYTFVYAEGFSYFSSDPRACANCHIMQDQYDSWLRSGHHAAAVCIDCHLPTSRIPQLVAKSENGYHHSWAFTFQDFHEPIMIKPRNSRILQDNCVRCHADAVHDVLWAGEKESDELTCVRCHASVGHGPRK